MGSYMFKVTAKIKTLADGTKANVAVFAYKTFGGWDRDEANARMYKKSGCARAENFAKAKGKNWMGRCVLGEKGTEAVEIDRGVFTDDWFYSGDLLGFSEK